MDDFKKLFRRNCARLVLNLRNSGIANAHSQVALRRGNISFPLPREVLSEMVQAPRPSSHDHRLFELRISQPELA